LGRLFVFTMGFHWDFAMKRLTSSHAGSEDEVAVFTAKPPAPAAVNAYSSLRQTVERYVGARVHGLYEVDLDGGLERASLGVLKALSGLLSGCRLRRVVADLTGGSRGIYQSVFLSLTLLRGVDVEVYVQSDTSDAWELAVPSSVMQLLGVNLARDLEETLKALAAAGGSMEQYELAQALGLSVKTVANRFYRLRSLGLAARRGRAGRIHLTGWGRLIGESLLLSERLGGCGGG